MLRIAFGKGRGASACIRLLESEQIVLPETFCTGRRVIYKDPRHGLECFLVRGHDLAWYIKNSHVDVAIGSKILFLDLKCSDIIEVAALPIGRCRLSLISADDQPLHTYKRIATRYPALTMQLLSRLIPGVELVPLAGCIETALFLGVCDAIVDIVETGWTLQEFELNEREVLVELNHSIWMRRDKMESLKHLQQRMPEVNWKVSPSAGTDQMV